MLLFYSLLLPKRMLIYENLYNITKLIKVGNKRTSLVIQGLRLCASCHSPQWLHQFTFPPTVLEGSLFFTSSPAFSVCGFFDDGHSDRFEQIPHYSFNLHFSNNEQCWASFHVGVGHLKINSKRKKKEKKSLCALRAGVLARFLVREPRSCCIHLCVDKKQNDRQSKESKGNVKGWKVKRDQEWAFRLQREAPAPSTLCWGQNANLDWHAQPAGGFPGGASGKEPACQSRKHKMARVGGGVWCLGQGDPPEGGNDNPLQHSCLENPMDRGAWRAVVHGVVKSQISLKQLSTSTQKAGRKWPDAGDTVLLSYKQSGCSKNPTTLPNAEKQKTFFLWILYDEHNSRSNDKFQDAPFQNWSS